MVLFAVAGACHPSQRVGAAATKGAVKEFAAQAEKVDPSEPGRVAESVARGAVKGVVSQLSEAEQEDQWRTWVWNSSSSATEAAVAGGLAQVSRPEQLQQLRQIARAAAYSALSGIAYTEGAHRDQVIASIADQAARGVVDALAKELGPTGEGALAQSLYATTEKLSASTVRGVQGQIPTLFPECSGPDRQRCVDERISDLSRSVAAGFGTGLRHAIAPLLAVIAFFLGVLVTLLISRRSLRRA